ncbi:MAG: GNAT family N-acetyltransferase [Chitinophagales bacterium]|nr:GNAT family N-acetyltransferase [Chitinophagales bacterium]
MNISLKKVDNEYDIRLVSKLSDIIWHQHYPSIITVEQIDYMLAKFHSPQVLTQQIESGQAYFLIQVDEERIGYCSFTEKEPFIYFLNKFYIDQTQQGKGIGKKVFALLREKMMAPKQIGLQVNRRNINAINFYFKVGFVIKEAKDFAIGEGYSMDDFIMEWSKMN